MGTWKSVALVSAVAFTWSCGNPPDAKHPPEHVASDAPAVDGPSTRSTAVDTSNAVVRAAVVREGTDFSIDLSASDGPVCVTVPAMLRDSKACVSAIDVPLDAVEGSVTIGVAQRRTGNDVIVAVVSSSVGSQPTVSDATVEDAVSGMKILMAHDPTAKVGRMPMEVSSAGVPHYAVTIVSLMQGMPVETRSYMMLAVDRTYSVAFVATPKQHAAHASWERAVVQSVRLARPATYAAH